MPGVMHYSLETYRKNGRLILLFSLSFLIAFAIPILAAFPTFNDSGAILIRTSSLFYFNITPLSASVIIIASIFSLLFLSFAIVSINVIVKHSRMHVRVSAEVLKGIEKYTGRIFAVLGLFTLAIFASEILTYGIKPVGLITAIVGLALTPFVFYAPASIVMEDSRIGRAMKRSAKFFVSGFGYFLIWLAMAIAAITLINLLFITAVPSFSEYLSIILNSVLVMPFLIVFQSEAYLKKFPMMRR